jgi:hypothetical protein
MLPHYLSSDDKIPLYAGKSLESIVLAIFPVTINRFGQSAGNLRSLTSLVESSETKHGLSEGDGSFFIGLGNSPKSKLGVQITLSISWTQKHRKTLELIASQFKGSWSYNKTHKFWVYDYLDLKRACELFNTKQHLTESGLELLLEIKSNMNSRRTSVSIKSKNDQALYS